MASIRKEFIVNASAAEAWDAIRDVGEVHRRVVPGFVRDCRMDGEARVVSFADGLVAARADRRRERQGTAARVDGEERALAASQRFSPGVRGGARTLQARVDAGRACAYDDRPRQRNDGGKHRWPEDNART